ncbi:MAG: hypothetical protein M1828_004539 [Chrysothrix sp. TS-e1954]|nr:MAG: hypothetical protein M1828_004539 [Chrysothrix sp. TS-e1954]
MASFQPEAKGFSSLDGSVWVLTGGANGIGEQLVKSLNAAGAFVVFGDVAEEAGEKLAASLGKDKATFVKTNVTSYADHVNLFKTALQKHGHVDHAVPVAGIGAKETWFSSQLSVDDVEKADSDLMLDINLKGVLYFTRVALPYLRHHAKDDKQKSITLISSVTGFLDAPHIPLYSITKHGVMGLMHALRGSDSTSSKIRVNCINPSFVPTAMTASFAKKWTSSGMPVNTTAYIAEVIMGLAVQTEVNGKAMYISDNKAWDIEEGLARTFPDWMGKALEGNEFKRAEFMNKVDKANNAGDTVDLDDAQDIKTEK